MSGHVCEVGRRVEMRRRHRRDAVRLRQEPAARHRVDAAPVVRVAEGEHDVAHRESGAEQEDVLTPVELEGVGRPWVAGVAQTRVELGAVVDRRVGRREVPDRQHHLVRVDRAAVRKPQRDVVRRVGDLDDLAGDPQQRQPGCAARLVEPRREVLAVRPARDEGPTGQRRVARPDEAEEVVGIVLERAHPPRRHVQRVTAGGRRVCDAADLPLDSLDEQDAADGCRRCAQEVDRDGRSAEPRSDDRDRALRAHAR